MPYKDPAKQRQATRESAKRCYHAPGSQIREYHRQRIAASRKKKAEAKIMDERVQAHDAKLREQALNSPAPIPRHVLRMKEKAQGYQGTLKIERGMG